MDTQGRRGSGWPSWEEGLRLWPRSPQEPWSWLWLGTGGKGGPVPPPGSLLPTAGPERALCWVQSHER